MARRLLDTSDEDAGLCFVNPLRFSSDVSFSHPGLRWRSVDLHVRTTKSAGRLENAESTALLLGLMQISIAVTGSEQCRVSCHLVTTTAVAATWESNGDIPVNEHRAPSSASRSNRIRMIECRPRLGMRLLPPTDHASLPVTHCELH